MEVGGPARRLLQYSNERSCLDQSGSSGGGYILQIKRASFADGLDVGCEGNRGVTMTPGLGPE